MCHEHGLDSGPRPWPQPRRVARRRGALALALVGGIALTGCTGHSSHNFGQGATPSAAQSGTLLPSGPGSSGVASSAPAAAPQLRALDAPTTVIGDSGPQAVSIAVSRALFDSAPVVVVSAPDAASVTQAVADAVKLSVPLLIADDEPPASPASSASSPTASAASGGAVADELHRLGCTTALGVGQVQMPVSVHAVDALAKLPAVSPPASNHDTTVLVHASGDAGSAAATATARAAGATVVAVDGNDPRADPHVVSDLAAAPAQHVVAVGSDFGSPQQLAARIATARTGDQLPAGGQLIFPGHRFVAMYGHPGGAGLGVLGAQGLDASIARGRDLAAQYDNLSSVPVVPTFEIIATVASGAAGRDGNYSNESTVESLRPWVEKAEASGFYVVLDLQPGRADVLKQAQLYASLLQSPDVGLAVDPEWALKPDQMPLEQIGSLDSSRINAVASWLDAFTASKHLPQKLFVVHQFRLSMIGNERQLKTDYDNIAVLIHMDGQGTQANKDATWRSVVASAPHGIPFGWKNFYKEDHPMLTPQQTMAHKPQPMMISYQ